MKKIAYFLLASTMAAGAVQAQNLGKLTSKDCKIQILRTTAVGKDASDRNLSELASIRDDSIASLRRLRAFFLAMLLPDVNTAEKAIRRHQTALSRWDKADVALDEIDASSKDLARKGWCEQVESYLLLGSALAKKDAAFHQQDIQFQLDLAKLYLENKRVDLALANLKLLLDQKKPDSQLSPAQKIGANYLMGQSYFAIKDYDSATSFLEQSVTLMEQNNPYSEDLLLGNLYLLAASQYLNNAFPRGEKTFEKISLLDKNNQMLSRGGSIYDQDIVTDYKSGNVRQAIRNAEKKLEVFSSRLDELQTKIKTQPGVPNELRKLLQEQLNTEYDQHKTMLTLAEILQSQSQFDRARDLYKQILASNKSSQHHQRRDFQLHTDLASLYLSTKEFSLAEDSFLSAHEIAEKSFISSHPSLTTSMANLAYIYKINGRTDFAEGLYLKLISRLTDASVYGYEELPAYYEYLGEIYLAKANYPDARKFYELAFEKNAALQKGKKEQLIRCTKALIVVYKKSGEPDKVKEMERELSKFESPAQKLKSASNKKSKA